MGKAEDEFDRMTAPLGQVRQRFAMAVERVTEPVVAMQLRECFAMVLETALHPADRYRFETLRTLSGADRDETVEAAVVRLVRERDAAAQAVVTLNEVRSTLHMGDAELSVDGAERVMTELERAERAAEAAQEALDERLRLDAEAEAGQRAVHDTGEACAVCGGPGGVTDPETCTTASCVCAAGRAREARVVCDAVEGQPTWIDRRIVERLSEVIGVLRARVGVDDYVLLEALDELRAIREVVRR